jgi:prolipoprotein diacylglyceryltransferase
VERGLTLLGGIAGAILINIPLFRKYHYSFFQVMDGAVIGLAFGIAFGRIGDLIIGDHLGKPTSWLLAFQYEGGNLSGSRVRRARAEPHSKAGRYSRSPTRRPAHHTGRAAARRGRRGPSDALYDMFFATCLFLVLYGLSRAPRRLGVLTLVFGAVYGRRGCSRTSCVSTSGCSA